MTWKYQFDRREKTSHYLIYHLLANENLAEVPSKVGINTVLFPWLGMRVKLVPLKNWQAGT